MIQFLATPIFYLTPYIFLWSVFNGMMVLILIRGLQLSRSNSTRLVAAFTTAIANIVWNWSIEFNQSTIYLNVDHPIFRISWADAMNGVGAFALTSLVLGLVTDKTQDAEKVAKIASLAAVVTIITDTFFF